MVERATDERFSTIPTTATAAATTSLQSSMSWINEAYKWHLCCTLDDATGSTTTAAALRYSTAATALSIVFWEENGLFLVSSSSACAKTASVLRQAPILVWSLETLFCLRVRIAALKKKVVFFRCIYDALFIVFTNIQKSRDEKKPRRTWESEADVCHSTTAILWQLLHLAKRLSQWCHAWEA